MASLEKDLTSGNVVSNLLKFAFPFILSNFVQSLYNIVDMIIVGKFVGTVGISGVNIGGQLTFLMTLIGISFCAGASIIIGQYMGAKDMENVEKTIATLLSFLVVVAFSLSVAMIILDDKILVILKTPQESYQYAKDYLNITVVGIVFILGYNALSSIMRAVGNSKMPLYLISIACMINVVLDYTFVGIYGMGVKGAGYATIISQGFSMIACIYLLSKNGFVFDFKPSSFKFHMDKLKLIFKLATPIVIQNVAMNISFLAMTGISNSLGVVSSAALGIVARFNGFAMLPSNAISLSISSIVAQNIGANQIDRAKQTVKVGLILAILIAIPFFLFAQFKSDLYIKIFADEPDLIESSIKYLGYFSFEYLIIPFYVCTMAMFVGAGHTNISSRLSMLSAIVLRLPLAFILVHGLGLGLAGIGLSAPLSTSISMIISVIMYRMELWRKPSKIALQNKNILE